MGGSWLLTIISSHFFQSKGCKNCYCCLWHFSLLSPWCRDCSISSVHLACPADFLNACSALHKHSCLFHFSSFEIRSIHTGPYGASQGSAFSTRLHPSKDKALVPLWILVWESWAGRSEVNSHWPKPRKTLGHAGKSQPDSSVWKTLFVQWVWGCLPAGWTLRFRASWGTSCKQSTKTGEEPVLIGFYVFSLFISCLYLIVLHRGIQCQPLTAISDHVFSASAADLFPNIWLI